MAKQPRGKLWITLGLLWVAHFMVDFMIGIWPVFKTMRQLDLATVGAMTAVAVMLGEGMQPLFGTLCDAGWRKHIVIGGLLAAGAATCYAFFNEYTFFFLLLLITCFGSGAFHPAATSAAGALSTRRKGFFISFFISAGAFGLAASQLVYTSTYIAFEGNTLLLLIPIALIAIAFAFHPVYAEEASNVAAPKRSKVNIRAIRTFFRRPELRCLYFIQVCNQSIWWGMIFLLPDILVQRGYETWISLGGGHLALILGGATMMTVAGYFADRYPTRRILGIASFCSITLLYSFFLLPTLSGTLLLPLLFCLGGSLGLVNPVSVALGNRWAPTNPGLVSAMMMGLAWCLSEGIGQGLGGILTTFFEYDAAAKAIALEGILLFGFAYLARNLPQDEEVVQPQESISE